MTSTILSAKGSLSLDGLCSRAYQEIYQPLCRLRIEAWRSPEPRPYAARSEGKPQELKVGDSWGEQLFDCAWFRFRSPQALEDFSNLVLRIDVNGELCIFDADGVPFRGLTCVRSEFDKSLGLPGKTVCRIEKWMFRDGFLEVWADAGFNDLFGRIAGNGKIDLAEIAEYRPDIRALYYDLEVLRDLHNCSDDSQLSKQKIAEAFAEAADCLTAFDRPSVAAARFALRDALVASPKRPSLKVSAIGHAHLDLAWLWPIRETIRKGARTLATVLYHLEQYPEYIFGCSQPQLFQWIKDGYPELYAKVRAAVRAGRIEPQGTFWVEPDCNIPSGESFVRQILAGSRFFREEFGLVPDFCWQPDVFGYNGQLPQILKKSGHRFFATQKLSWNVVNRFPYQSFVWEGIDGTDILVHMLPEETYNGPAAPRSLRRIGETYAQRDVSGHVLMGFGIGDGGGGPDGEHLERLRRQSKLADLPSVQIQSTSAFFKQWMTDAAKFPRWKGELYLERHQGTLTTQALTKRNNRQCEILLREAEWLSCLGEMYCGHAYPEEFFATTWKEVLLYQFHDILPGSSIRRVYEESNARYAIILESLHRLINDCTAALAKHLNASHLIVNSLPWTRKEWLEVNGQWQHVEVPALGYCAWNATAASAPENFPIKAETNFLENSRLTVRFAEGGTISSIFDRKAGREMLAPGAVGNRFVVIEDSGDAWDFAQNIPQKDPWIYLRLEEQFPILENSRAWTEGPRASLEQQWRFGSSTITQTISLEEGDDKVVFDTRIDWQEKKAMLRVRFPVAVHAETAQFEIPFGSIERSTSDSTLIEKAQLEVAGQQWISLSEQDYGVGLLNDCKYGFRVKGSVLDLTILRSVPHPGGALIGKEDKSAGDPGAVYTDLGLHQLRYALLPIKGRRAEAEITAAARAFNLPLQVATGDKKYPGEAAAKSFAIIDCAAIEVPAIKQSEDGKAWIIRLCNVSPEAQRGSMIFAFPFESVVETDLMENALGDSILSKTKAVTLSFHPFEIKTLRLAKASA